MLTLKKKSKKLNIIYYNLIKKKTYKCKKKVVKYVYI